jgi:hypothetical protein
MRRRRPSPLVLALVALTLALLAWRNARADGDGGGRGGVRVDGRAGIAGIVMPLNGPSDLTVGGWAALALERPAASTTFGVAVRAAFTGDWLPVFEDGSTHGTTAGIAVTARRGRWSAGLEGGVTWTTYGREPETTNTNAHGFIGVPLEARFGGATAFVIELAPTLRLDDAQRSRLGGSLRLGLSRRF